MTVTHHRFFGAFLDTQENWLNQMAKKGYRLVKTGKITYEFEETEPDSIEYKMEFIADKTADNANDYRKSLEEMGYRVFAKNINLQYSWGKARARPWAKKGAKVATKRTTFDRELFIVEKQKDGKPFKLHTTNKDRAEYYTGLRNMWLWPLAAFGVLGCIYMPFAINSALAFLVFAIGAVVPVITYQKKVIEYKNKATTQE